MTTDLTFLPISLRACRSAFVAIALAWAVAPPVASAQSLGSAFRAYPLTHAAAPDVAEQLSRLLDVLPEPSDVIVDAPGNRLLVSGGDAAQTLAAQLIESLDQPASAAGGAPALRAYRVEPLQLDALAARLRGDFAHHPHVRVATDARTSQLLVVAPESVQQQIAARLQAPAAVDRGPAGSAATAAPAAALTPPEHSIQLAYATCSEIEAMLSSAFAGQYSSTASAGQQQSSGVLSLGDGAVVRLAADHRTGIIQFSGQREAQALCGQLVAALDRAHRDAAARRQIVPLERTSPPQARRAVEVFSLASDARPRAAGPAAGNWAPERRQAVQLDNVPFLARMFQPDATANDAGAQQPDDNAGNQQPSDNQQPAADIVVPAGALGTGLVGPVQIEFLEGLDVMIVSGNDRDVERVLRIIEDIERLSTETEPVIEVYQLQHTGSEQLAEVARQVYDEVLASRQGQVSITALVKPNALLVIGRAESVKAVTDLVGRLDQPVDPGSQFAVFRLKHMPATAALTTVEEFFEEREGLGAQVQVTADFRTNALVVHGSPRDLAEVGELLSRLDSATSDAVSQVRVITLRNSLATELAPMLQYAISAQAAGASGNQGVQQVLPGAQQGSAAQPASPISSMLELLTIDPEGQRRLTSGVLTDVRITADARANALVISAPADSMELIVALVQQLDQIPAATAQIKVFTIVKGDASSLVEMLRSLFGQATGGGQFTQQGAAVVAGENPLVPLRFSVDQRTNSIIAQGGANDLNIVEAILLRLDASDVEERRNTVYRLKNSYALDVANAINEFLQSQRDLQQSQPGTLSPFEQLEREVVVVPELVSNSLIVSATPRYFEEIAELVEDLDERPPMVVIHVLIAEVSLNNTDEFGIELGLQDSVLFDRSLLADLVTTTNSTQTNVGGAVVTSTQEIIQGATLTPGYVFNQAAIPNSGSDISRANSSSVGGQGLTNFALGRINGELGYGGLVLSAYSESVNLLIRALQESRRLEVLSRPQVTTLDNQSAFIQVGARVPRVQGVTLNETGQVNNVTDVNVGLILAVTPRISPDGLVVMEVDAEKSALGPEEEGVPISISATGEVVRQPLINTTTAQTTVSALSGQTIVLGGLITKSTSQTTRRVPVLSDIPILGNLFRYDAQAQQRTELLIILTPRIVRNQDEMELVKQEEAARMHWCLSDVVSIHGESGLNHRAGVWEDSETIVIYPDVDPTGMELLPPAELLDQIPPGEAPPTDMPPPPMLPEQSTAQPLGATSPTPSPPQLQLKAME